MKICELWGTQRLRHGILPPSTNDTLESQTPQQETRYSGPASATLNDAVAGEFRGVRVVPPIARNVMMRENPVPLLIGNFQGWLHDSLLFTTHGVG